MTHKTKATLPGRQCDNTKQIQHTRGNAGGQSLSAPVITGTTALALLTSPNGGCLFLHTSYGVAQILSERNTGKPRSFECCMVVVYRGQRNFAPAVFIQVSGYFWAFLLWLKFNRVVTSLSHSSLELGGSFPSKSAKWQVLNAGPIHPNYLPSSCYSRKPDRIIAIHVLGKDLGRISFLSHKFRMCNKNALSHLCASYFSSNQLLGSMPRCCNSLRIILLIQADTDASPSCARACLIPSSRLGSTRNAICLLPLALISMVDIWLTPDYFEVVIKCMTCAYQKATPRSAGTLPRRLTKPLYEVTIMAELQHTQTRPKFTWRFFSCQQSRYFTVTASTEQQARLQLPDAPCLFAARLPVQEVGHV